MSALLIGEESDEPNYTLLLHADHHLFVFANSFPGFGIDLGNRMAYFEHQNWVSTDGCHEAEWWVKPPLFVITLVCWNVLMKAAPGK